MTFDVEEYRRITRQILVDISRVWSLRKLLGAMNLYGSGMSLEEIARIYGVKPKTVENYIKKCSALIVSEDKEIQYRLTVATATPDKHAGPEELDMLRSYVIRNKIHKEDWFFLNSIKNSQV
ncbi:hypothetical protein [Pantoea stewartii]|uniref:hypothetical protein n=1 Tax=Pantoea stewartii TaxID=66269 RepID=UPI00138FA4BB|nr:hypothetical protein [Pantoea stewartii]